MPQYFKILGPNEIYILNHVRMPIMCTTRRFFDQNDFLIDLYVK